VAQKPIQVIRIKLLGLRKIRQSYSGYKLEARKQNMEMILVTVALGCIGMIGVGVLGLLWVFLMALFN
jgi:hypothetical protein